MQTELRHKFRFLGQFLELFSCQCPIVLDEYIQKQIMKRKHHLEGKVFQTMSNSSFGFKTTASFDKKCNGSCRLVVVYRSNSDAGTVNNSGKVTRYALDRSGRRPRCEHGEIIGRIGERTERQVRILPLHFTATTKRGQRASNRAPRT